ncbi:MAG: hypothetical protein PHT12_00325 [Patescibacteria group bacterium]|nr:hypothetical protein [Patescibacteria group bacterium]
MSDKMRDWVKQRLDQTARCYGSTSQQDGPYKPLRAMLETSGDWSTLASIADIAGREREQEILVRLRMAAHHHDDVQALRFLDALFLAITDTALLGIVDSKMFVPFGEPGTRAIDEAASARAKAAVELWTELPIGQPGTAREFVAQDETKPVSINFPSLLQTKAALLIEIGRRCRQTQDEAEADRLFAFLADRNFRFDPEHQMFEAVARVTTDQSFPPARLARYYLLVAAKKGSQQSRERTILSSALASAFVRAGGDGIMRYAVAAVAPFLTDSSARWGRLDDPLLQAAAEFQGCHAKALMERLPALKELVAALKSRSDTFGFGGLEAPVTVRFESLNGVVVDIGFLRNGPASTDFDKHHDYFAERRNQVRAWLRLNPGMTVALNMVVVSRYHREGNPPEFERRETLR